MAEFFVSTRLIDATTTGEYKEAEGALDVPQLLRTEAQPALGAHHAPAD